MIEELKPDYIELLIWLNPEYLSVEKVQQSLPKSEAGTGKGCSLFLRSFHRLDQWITDWIDQLRDDLESEQLFIWGRF